MKNESDIIISIETKVQNWIHVMTTITFKLCIYVDETRRGHGGNETKWYVGK